VADGLLRKPGKHETSFPIHGALEVSVRGRCTARVVDVVVGNEHGILAIIEKGGISACGRSEQGQLGRRVLTCREINGTLPEKVVLGACSCKAVRITAGGFMSSAADMVGDVCAWSRSRLTPAEAVEQGFVAELTMVVFPESNDPERLRPAVVRHA
jgi:alpha-tubulin suppressor-like RCC1 family protein